MKALRRRAILPLFVMLFIPAWIVAQRSGSSVATDRIFQAIGVRQGMTICEVGAGDGDLSIAAARIVGPRGRVYTSELGEDRVERLRKNVAESGLPQITVVTGEADKTNFPDASCDALFMRNVYHHFGNPAAMNTSIAASLKPGARAAIVDFTPPRQEAAEPGDRGDDGTHGVMAETVTRELKEAGLEAIASEAGTGRWYMVVVTKATP